MPRKVQESSRLNACIDRSLTFHVEELVHVISSSDNGVEKNDVVTAAADITPGVPLIFVQLDLSVDLLC